MKSERESKMECERGSREMSGGERVIECVKEKEYESELERRREEKTGSMFHFTSMPCLLVQVLSLHYNVIFVNMTGAPLLVMDK